MFARVMLRKLFVGVGIVSATVSMTDGNERELRNQVLHGILNPNSYDGLRMLKPVLEARNCAGVTTDRFFCVDLSYMVHLSAGNRQKIGELKQRIKQWQKLLKEYDCDELWIWALTRHVGTSCGPSVRS